MGNRDLGVVNHAAELGEEIAELWCTAEEIQALTPAMAMSGASFCTSADTAFDTALAQYKHRGMWNAPAPELYRLAWECAFCHHRCYSDQPPLHCAGCQSAEYLPIRLRVQDVDQSDANHHKKRPATIREMDLDCIRYHLPEGVLLDNFGIHRDRISLEPDHQPLGRIVK